MYTYKITFTLFVLLAIFGCNSKKSTSKNEKEISQQKENKLLESKMLSKGFKKGTILYSDNANDCEYTIRIEEENFPYLLDPLNLEDPFKVDGLKIWVTFNQLRMRNRCEKANPMKIVEIQLRE